jgi:glycosyltransferase involved in cell wall biosynthesis
MSAPLVSVIMPAYNARPYLAEAVRSILRQTHTALELLAVDDGSDDGTAELLDALAREDPRLRVFHRPHRGIVPALNEAVDHAAGEFIARMDADDLCRRRRLEAQVRFLLRHPDVDVCGTWIRSLDERPPYVYRYETRHEAIRCDLLFGPMFPHGSAMFRADTLRDGENRFSERHPLAEDYDLWVRLTERARFATIPAILYGYRQHPAQATRRSDTANRESQLAIMRSLLAVLGLGNDEEALRFHASVARWTFARDSDEAERIHAWFLRILDANARAQRYPRDVLRGVLARRWHTVLQYFTQHGPGLRRRFADSPLNVAEDVTPLRRTALAMKFLVRWRAGR